MGSLQVCERIECYNNKLTSIPSLPACQRIDCFNNKLTLIPSLPVCTRIYCYNNQLKDLQSQNIPACQVLNCSNNKLERLPDLLLCEDLNCSGNRLTSLPNLPVCEYLNCSGNRLTSLPASLHKILTLDCSENQLTSLPTLRFCYDLRCSNNRLTLLPNLLSCRILICSNNQLTKLPILSDDLFLAVEFDGNPDLDYSLDEAVKYGLPVPSPFQKQRFRDRYNLREVLTSKVNFEIDEGEDIKDHLGRLAPRSGPSIPKYRVDLEPIKDLEDRIRELMKEFNEQLKDMGAKQRYEDIEDYEIRNKLRRIVDEIKKLEKQKKEIEKNSKNKKSNIMDFLGGKIPLKYKIHIHNKLFKN